MRVEQGEEEITTTQTPTQDMPIAKDDTPALGRIMPLEPPPAEFILDTPPISAAEM